MLFYLLFVISTAFAANMVFDPQRAVVLKNTQLLTKCCYNTAPAKFTPITGYAMVNSLCGVNKLLINVVGEFSYSCFSSDKNVIPSIPSRMYVVEETKLDVGILGKPYTFKCHIGENDNLDYSWLNLAGAPILAAPLTNTLYVPVANPEDIYTCKMSVKRAGKIGTLKLSKQLKPVEVSAEFSITLPDDANAVWIIDRARIACTTPPICSQMISYADIATAKLEIIHNNKIVEIPLV
jgi:hypothetical protein